MPFRMAAYRVEAQLADIDHPLHDRVIARQGGEPSIAQQIRPAVAHMTDHNARLVDDQARDDGRSMPDASATLGARPAR